MIDAGSYDPDGGPVTLSLDISNFNCSHVGDTIIVMLTVTDDELISNTCWSEVIIGDKLGPLAACYANISLSLDATGNATLTPSQVDAGSMDNCPLTMTLSKSSFDCSDIGSQVVFYGN